MTTFVATVALIVWALLGVLVLRWEKNVLGEEFSRLTDVSSPIDIDRLRRRILQTPPSATPSNPADRARAS